MLNRVVRATTLACMIFAYYGQRACARDGPGGPHQPLGNGAVQARSGDDLRAFPQDQNHQSQNQPDACATEIAEIESMHRAILANYPIERWRFETVRSRYMALLKRAGTDPDLEETIRVRLAGITRHEQAAEAARTIRTTLAESHRRDREVSRLKRRIAAAGHSHSEAYSAVGFMQSSDQVIDGRKLHVLIADNGSTVAYLDLPPGLDPDAFLARRVGVRGDPHFNEDLGARLITVRDIDSTEATR
jgi:hypothetical protein